MANTDNLAQASLPRLGEMSRGSPKAFCVSCRSSDQNSSRCLAWAKGISPKRDCAGATVLVVELSPRRRGARLSESHSRLSETLQPERGAGQGCVPSCCFLCAWMFKVCLYGLLYDGLMGMSMHDWEGIIYGGL